MTTGTDKKYIVGIDYSLTSPAITEYYGTEWNYNSGNICHSCLASTERQWSRWTSIPNIEVKKYPEYRTDIARYNALADWTIWNGIIKLDRRPTMVYIEDYAYAATGRVFNIAENMAILKDKLTNNGIRYTMIAPTAIKKFATGKGNANKELMYESFLSDTGRDLETELEVKRDKNPVSDIVDSYWICKYGYENGNHT
jgi:hypothetical protein